MEGQRTRNKEERKKRLRFKEENEENRRRSINTSAQKEQEKKSTARNVKLGTHQPKCQGKHDIVDVDGQKFDILKKLGGGNISSTYEVLGKNKKLYVLKMMKLKVEKSVLKEVNLLTKFAIEPKVVRLEVHEVRLTRNGVMMLLLMEHGDCSIRDIFLQPKNISISSLLFYWESILKCVRVLHSKNIIHLDIKPSNFILIQGTVKLTDLTSAELLPARSNSMLIKYPKGTAGFTGPECSNHFKDKMYRYSLKTDVFALGVILHALIFKTVTAQSDNMGLFTFLRKAVKNAVGENQFHRPSVEQLLTDLGTLAVIPSPKKRSLLK